MHKVPPASVHWAFQISRKVGRPIQALAILSGASGLVRIFAQSAGQEMWYFPSLLLGIMFSTVAVTGIFWPARKVVSRYSSGLLGRDLEAVDY